MTKTKPTVNAVLSCDPGKDNYAWAILDLSTGAVIDTGMFGNTLYDLTFMQFVQQWRRHLVQVKALLRRKDVNFSALCVERLTPRPGMGSGAAAEYVNLMIGALYVLARLRGIKLIVPTMPSTWKGWLGSVVSGEKNVRALESSPVAFGFPQVLKSERKTDNFPIKEHQFDAIGIGLWFVAVEQHRRLSLKVPDPKKTFETCKKSLRRIWKERS